MSKKISLIFLTGSKKVIKREVYQIHGRYFTLWYGNEIELLYAGYGVWRTVLDY